MSDKPLPRNGSGHRLAARSWNTAVSVFVVGAVLLVWPSTGFSLTQESAARNRTGTALGAIRAALDRYKEKFGDYPTPANPEETGLFNGKPLRTGAAHMLYQAITGDGTSAILLLPAPPADNRESDGRLDEAESDRALGASTLPKGVVSPNDLPAGTAKPRLIVDGWGRPFQYIKADPDPAKNKAINSSSYDLWSFGPKIDFASLSDSPAARRDDKRTDYWITNWR